MTDYNIYFKIYINYCVIIHHFYQLRLNLYKYGKKCWAVTQVGVGGDCGQAAINIMIPALWVQMYLFQILTGRSGGSILQA